MNRKEKAQQKLADKMLVGILKKQGMSEEAIKDVLDTTHAYLEHPERKEELQEELRKRLVEKNECC